MAIRSVTDLVSLASAGGGFKIDASRRTTIDLVSIASAASRKGAKIYLTGLQIRPIQDLISIASAGNGCVFFEDI